MATDPVVAAILAGGDGTRMAADGVPGQKVLLPVLGRAILEWVADAARPVVDALVVLMDYEAEQVEPLADRMGADSIDCRGATPFEMVCRAARKWPGVRLLVLSGDTLVAPAALASLVQEDGKLADSFVHVARQNHHTDSQWELQVSGVPRLVPTRANTNLERVGWLVTSRCLNRESAAVSFSGCPDRGLCSGFEPGSINAAIDGLMAVGTSTVIREVAAPICNINRRRDLAAAEAYLRQRLHAEAS